MADLFFYETAVRLHRAGEGAPYTALKPAGHDVGPVIPLAERAIEADDPSDLAGVAARRAQVGAALGLQVWAHELHAAVHAAAHEGAAHEDGRVAS